MDLLKYYSSIVHRYPEYVNQKEVCEILKINRTTAANLQRIGEIPYEVVDERVGKHKRLMRYHRIKLIDILAYMFLHESQKKIDWPDIVEYVHNFDELIFYLPRYLSKEQFRKVCHISKKTAIKLFDMDLVESVKTGANTSNYKISRDVVIKYLIERDSTPEKYKFPASPVKSRISEPYPDHIRLEILDYYLKLFSDYPDMLTTKEASLMTGFSMDAGKNWIAEGRIKSFSRSNAYLIPKISLVRWIGDAVFAVPRLQTLISMPIYAPIVDYLFNRDKRNKLAREDVLIYNPTDGNYDIRYDVNEYHGGLEAGTPLDVLVKNKWISTRLIRSKSWELEGIDAKDINGLRVKIY